jgi:hydrogenase-4 component E
MINILIIIFTMTLFYMGAAGRLTTYIRVLFLQGLLLFGVAYLELKDVNFLHMLMIVLETLIFKAILIPLFYDNLIKRNSFQDERDPTNPNFFALFKVGFIIIFAFILAYALHDEHLKITYFASSVSAILTGMLMIVRRKKLITHIMGFLVIENGIFLLSLAIGSEMPFIVNMGILLDLITSVLLFGFFLYRIGEVSHTQEVESLSGLKD